MEIAEIIADALKPKYCPLSCPADSPRLGGYHCCLECRFHYDGTCNHANCPPMVEGIKNPEECIEAD